MNEPQTAIRKDIKICLLTWLALEGLCFVAMPLCQVYPFKAVQFWFIPSLLVGPLGALIIAVSTGAVVEAQNLLDVRKKRQRFWFARGLGMVGFLGVSFPLTLTFLAFGQVLQEFGETL